MSVTLLVAGKNRVPDSSSADSLIVPRFGEWFNEIRNRTAISPFPLPPRPRNYREAPQGGDKFLITNSLDGVAPPTADPPCKTRIGEGKGRRGEERSVENRFTGAISDAIGDEWSGVTPRGGLSSTGEPSSDGGWYELPNVTGPDISIFEFEFSHDGGST